VSEAVRKLTLLDKWDIDFAEQPVPADPVSNMVELKRKSPVPLAANEGLWRAAGVWDVIHHRACDVLCFSPYWAGSIGQFSHLAHAAAAAGIATCKHTHGELGLAAAAGQQVLLTLPKIVLGHQQTANMMSDDILQGPLPIATGPQWNVSEGPGLGVSVDEDKLEKYHNHYNTHGQYLPYVLDNMGQEDPTWRQA